MNKMMRSRVPAEELARHLALREIFDCMSVGLGVAVEDGSLIDANEALLTLLGVDLRGALGRTLDALLGSDLALSRDGDPAGRRERTFVRADGQRLWVRITVADVSARDGGVALHALSVEDITEIKALESALRDRALRDPVTGLPNRYLLEDRLAHALAQRERDGHELALLFVDLDGFKRVNDTAGHQAGDVELREAGRRIVSCARAVDTVARWAGDEFVVLCDGVGNVRDAERIAERIAAACAEPFQAGGLPFTLGASVGMSMTDTPRSANADALLDLADKAMYADKSSRRDARAPGSPSSATPAKRSPADPPT